MLNGPSLTVPAPFPRREGKITIEYPPIYDRKSLSSLGV